MQLMWTYQLAADLEKRLGITELADQYVRRSNQLKQTIQRKYWDSSRQLYADTETKDSYSQHANSLAILAGVVPAQQAPALARKMLTDTTLAPASIYFKFYLHQALVQAGLGDDYLNWLGKWQENIAMGLTTWAETSDVNTSRSDCHAWGASPNIEFFRTILGIDSDAPGFSRIKITPRLGSLINISGEMPHPNGKVSVRYQVTRDKLQAQIELPEKTPGSFVWRGKTYPLKPGINTLSI